MSDTFVFHHGWRFCLTSLFPMERAVASLRDARGRLPLEADYDDGAWERVTLPHTFNGQDLGLFGKFLDGHYYRAFNLL